MTKYIQIVFLQGDEAEEVLNIIDEKGELAGIEYLNQWNFNEGEIIEGELPAGKGDFTFKEGDFILNYRPVLSYAGLVQLIEE